jgi:hypothetical protein
MIVRHWLPTKGTGHHGPFYINALHCNSRVARDENLPLASDADSDRLGWTQDLRQQHAEPVPVFWQDVRQIVHAAPVQFSLRWRGGSCYDSTPAVPRHLALNE